MFSSQAVEEFPDCGALLQQRAAQRLGELNQTSAVNRKKSKAGAEQMRPSGEDGGEGHDEEHEGDAEAWYHGGGGGPGGGGAAAATKEGRTSSNASKMNAHGGERASSGIQTAPVSSASQQGATTQQRKVTKWFDESFEAQQPVWCAALLLLHPHTRMARRSSQCSSLSDISNVFVGPCPCAGKTRP